MVQNDKRRTQRTRTSNIRDLPRKESSGPTNSMIMTPQEIADYAVSLVSGDRQNDYGHPIDDFTRAGKIWEAILGFPVSAEQVALCMVGVKIAREVNRQKLDNAVDGIGYFLTLTMVQQERAERERLNNQNTQTE